MRATAPTVLVGTTTLGHVAVKAWSLSGTTRQTDFSLLREINMSTYKRWFPPLLVVDGITVTPGVLLGRKRRLQNEKRQEQRELRAWEGEGGNLAPLSVALQLPLFAEAPGADTGNPSFERPAYRLGSHAGEPKTGNRRDR
jgi:hypothetical protein